MSESKFVFTRHVTKIKFGSIFYLSSIYFPTLRNDRPILLLLFPFFDATTLHEFVRLLNC